MAAADVAMPVPGDSEFRPGGALGRLVESLWFGAPTASGLQHVVEPDGRMDVVLAYDAAAGQALAFGTTTVGQRFALEPGCSYLGIRFRPGCTPRMIEPRPAEIRDRHECIGEVAGIRADLLLERAATAATPLAALRSVASALDTAVRHLDQHEPLATALARYVDGRDGDVRVTVLAEQAGVSERQLERLFRDAVGLSPKLYARIVRYRRVRAALDRGARPSAGLALHFGYTDQSHLLRDLRSFAGAAG